MHADHGTRPRRDVHRDSRREHHLRPVLGPSFFGSWFPFPDNRALDWERFGREADFLYISHRHRDHFDPTLLERYIRKDIEVLLPEYPIDDLEQDIRALGYTNITYAPAGRIIERGDLCLLYTSPSPRD